MSELFPCDLDQQIRSVEREIRMRETVYPTRVAAKKMTQRSADYELGAMRAVLETLKLYKAGMGRLRDNGE